MRILFRWGELFWAGVTIAFIVRALEAPNEIVKAIYTLCIVVSLATAFLLRAMREK